MAKTIKEMMIQVRLKKDTAGEVQAEASAHVQMGASEYPEFNQGKGIPLALTETQETAVVNFARGVLQDILGDENAEDGIPTPEA